MIILTSDGLTSEAILREIKENLDLVSGFAALVPTASDYREKDDNVPILTEQMRELGLEARCVDVEYENPASLLMYDVVVLMGGNPYILLACMKKWPHSDRVLKRLAQEHILIGISAGSMILGTDISIAADITPEMADGYTDDRGFGLVDFCVMPHYIAYQTVFAGMDRILERRRQEGKEIRTVSDREAIVWKPESGSSVYLEDAGYRVKIREGFEADRMDIVLFDLYGTLIDIYTDEEQWELWEKMSLFFGYQEAAYMPGELKEAYGGMIREQEEKMRESCGEEFPEICVEDVFAGLYRKKGIRTSKMLVRSTGQMFRALSTRYVRLYHGAKELLLALKEDGKKVYALSNAQRLYTEYEMKLLGIYDLFDEICLSSDWGSKKPSRQFYNCLLDGIPPVPMKILMVGNDEECDVIPARELGLYTCYIQSNLSPFTERQPDCDLYLGHTNLPELTACLTGRRKSC